MMILLCIAALLSIGDATPTAATQFQFAKVSVSLAHGSSDCGATAGTYPKYYELGFHLTKSTPTTDDNPSTAFNAESGNKICLKGAGTFVVEIGNGVGTTGTVTTWAQEAAAADCSGVTLADNTAYAPPACGLFNSTSVESIQVVPTPALGKGNGGWAAGFIFYNDATCATKSDMEGTTDSTATGNDMWVFKNETVGRAKGCLLTGGTSTVNANPVNSYMMYCDGATPTFAMYAASTTCATSVTPTKTPLYTAADKKVASCVELNPASTTLGKLWIKATAAKEADIGCTAPSTSPASAVNTAAAAAVLAAGALIL